MDDMRFSVSQALFIANPKKTGIGYIDTFKH